MLSTRSESVVNAPSSSLNSVTAVQLYTLTACTLVAIATGDTAASASAPSSDALQPGGGMVAAKADIGLKNRQSTAIAQITPPETASEIPQFSAAATSQSSRLGTDVQPESSQSQPVQYYQDYQSVAVPTPAPTSQPASPPVTAPDTLPAANQSQPRSLHDPIWVVPTQAPSPTSVTVPNLHNPPPSSPAPVPPQSPAMAGSADLAVIATDVQVVGVEPELQRVALNTIKTKLGGQTSNSQLKQDVAELLDTGLFATAMVSSRPNPNGINVVFQVSPILVRSLQLSGAHVLTLAVVNDIFRSQLGHPVSPSALALGVKQINAWYVQNGYTLARVLTLQPTREGLITVEVAEGVVGEVKVRFVNQANKTTDNQGRAIEVRTQPDFIRRQIQLQPGQVFQDAVVRQDIQRLNQLGTLSEVKVTLEGDARRVNVTYNLSERSPRMFNVGAGYNEDIGVYGTVNFQDINFAGLAQKLGANVIVGSNDIQGDISFKSPYRDTDPSTPGYGATVFRRGGLSNVFTDEIKLPNGSRVRESRIGGSISLEHPLAPTWNGVLGLNYTNISLRDRDGKVFAKDANGNPLSLSGTGVDDLTTISFTASRDLRDNPGNPGRGSFLSLSTEQSIPVGRGEILGNRLQANYSQYIPVDWIKTSPADQPQVLAFNLQGGTTVGDLPPYNAFVLGGSSSVRGYGFGDVASSRSYVLATAEYRFPIYRFIGGVVFADFASDLGSSGDVLGEPGVQRGKPGSGAGLGAGLRFASPIGIVRADFGVSDQGDTRLQFGFGQKF